MQLDLNVNMLSRLSDYIAYDMLLQYLKELVDQARMQMGSKNYPDPQMAALRKNVTEASAQVEALQQQVQTKADALIDLDRQMNYLRQATSSQLLERYQQNYRFSGNEGGL